MKTDGILSEIIGACDCCGQPVYHPDHQLARDIIERIPGQLKPAALQKLHDEIVELVEESLGIGLEDVDGKPAVVN